MSGDEDFIYQLRHIGPPPSCQKSPLLMRLSLGVTKIGRGQNNDYFLDSTKLKNFISRYHAEVIGTKNENGKVEFVLTDKGLNGTFINDYRTNKTCMLEVGDKITFGHTNGYKIQPGCFASQPESEFQFIFEQIPKSSRTAESSLDNFNREEPTEAILEQKKFSDRSLLSDKNSNIQSPQITSTKDLQRGLDSENEENEDIESAVITKVDTTKGSSKTSTSKDKGKKSLEVSQESVSSKSVKEKVSSALAETLPAVELDDDDDEEEEQIEESEEEDLDKNKKLKKDDDDEEEEEEEEDVGEKDEEDDSDAESIKREKERKPRKPVKKKKRVKSSFTKPRNKPKAKETKADVISFSEENESSEDEEPPKPAARSQKSKKKSVTPNIASTASNKGKNTRKRKDSGSSKATDAKRRKTRGRKDKDDGGDKDLSDGVEWYEEDTCEAVDCKRPKNKRTPWVQCDDCDGWYHTVCVGANYKQVKDDNASFSCGCT